MVKIDLPVPDNCFLLSYFWYFGLFSGTILEIESICSLPTKGALGSQQNGECAMGKEHEHQLGWNKEQDFSSLPFHVLPGLKHTVEKSK